MCQKFQRLAAVQILCSGSIKGGGSVEIGKIETRHVRWDALEPDEKNVRTFA
jgi:hypothetical protein